MELNEIKNIAVFCGSNIGNHPAYYDAAVQFAKALIKLNINLIYGGANVGLMGVVADTVLNDGGKVIGVIPQSLVEFEVAHKGLTHLHIVETMHARKKLIFELADGFIMLPGGIGTLDEFFEILTSYQLGFHAKPCGIINTNHYFDLLLNFLNNSVAEGFIREVHRNIIFIEESPIALLDKFYSFKSNNIPKWLNFKTSSGSN